MTTWQVIRKNGEHDYVDVVTADYLVHEAGSLLFRRQTRSYPEIVKAYAAGHWLSVEHVREERCGCGR